MKNEHYYRQELENKIEEFIETEGAEGDFGWVGENAARLMADAAFSVLMASKDVQDYLIKNNESKV